jgi:hypothetical protein
MSNSLAIASVSAVLRNLLDNGVVDDTIVSSVGNVKVSAVAPDLISVAPDAPSQINLFMYQVTANSGWRNVGLPSRDDRGERRANAPLALDLHFLVTAYAGRDFHAEILLGRAMQILHETPGLSRESIRRGLGVPDPVPDPANLLPPDLKAIGLSELDDQIEAIKVTPQYLGSDEMSKLWTAIQSKLRPSMAYVVSVVLIESKRPTRQPLPVARRKLYVSTLRSPQIERVLSQETPGDPLLIGAPILANHRLVLAGTNLKGDRTLVRIGASTVVPAAGDVQDSQIIVQLPPDLTAGVQSAQIVHEAMLGEPAVPHAGVSSNLAPFVLRPQILIAQMQTSPSLLRLDIEPPLSASQRAVVFLNEIVAPASPPAETLSRAYSFPVPALPTVSPPTPAARLDIPIGDVAAGEYLVRLQVDGAESPLQVDAQGRYDRPAVTIP